MPLSHWGSPFIGGSKLRGEQATPLLSPSSQPAPGARLRMELRTDSLEERTGQCCFSSHRDVHSLEIILTTLEERASLILITEKAMAPHSSTLAWKIPWTEELGTLQSLGSLRVGNDRAISLSLFPFLHWRSKGQPTPVFLPGESQGWGSLVGCRLWGRPELDTTEAT